MNQPDPEANDQHGGDTVEAAIIVGLTFLAMLPVVALDKFRDWAWRVLHGE